MITRRTLFLSTTILSVTLSLPTGSKDASSQSQEKEKSNICTTAGCVLAAADLLNSIDFSKNPCDSFFDYACGKWVKTNGIPDDKSRWDTFAVVDERVKNRLKGLYEDPLVQHTDSRVINYVFDVYKKCMNTTELARIKSQPLLAYFDSIGGWPILKPDTWKEDGIDLTDLIISALRDMTTLTLLRLEIDSDSKNVTNYIIYFDQINLGLGYGTRDYYLDQKTFSRQINAYKKLIADMAKLLASDSNVTLDEQQIKKDVEQIVEFERQIAEIMKPEEERRNETLMYNKRFLASFDASLKFLDLTKVLKVNLPGDVYERLIEGRTDSYEIIVREPEYFEKFDNLILKTDKRILVNFIGWLVASSAIGQLDTRFEDIQQDFMREFKGRLQKSARWKSCTSAATSLLDKAAGSFYVRQYFSPKDRDAALEMIQNLKKAFKSLLDKNTWMDRDTKVVALEKLDFIVDTIGYPDYAFNDTGVDEYYTNLTMSKNDSFFQLVLTGEKWDINRTYYKLLETLDRKQFNINPAIVNAYYNPTRNSIAFPAGILQAPFFSGSFPNYVNYGAMGSVIGHEITHGFDDQGRQFDKYGSLSEWWSRSARENFLVQKTCIVDQYSSFVSKDVNRTVNGKLTQGENIADNGGVKQAFKAYQQFVKARGNPEPILPGLNLTDEQLFFASYAQFWCGKSKPAARINQILTDPHSPENFRVNGALSNSEAFAKVFDCPKNSPMNPTLKCSVW